MPMFVHLSVSYLFFQIHSSSISSKPSLNNRLLNTPTLCSLNTLCIIYYAMLKLSIYLSGFRIKSTVNMNSYRIMVSIFHLIQSLYYFILTILYNLCLLHRAGSPLMVGSIFYNIVCPFYIADMCIKIIINDYYCEHYEK